MSVGLGILVLSTKGLLCAIAKTAPAVVATLSKTYTHLSMTPMTLTTKKGTTPMDISNLNYDYENEWDDEPLTPEEQARADRAYYQQQEQEAYAEFLQSPYAFD